MDAEIAPAQDAPHEKSTDEGQAGVVVGVLLGLSAAGQPLVAFAGGPANALPARSTVTLRASDIGSQVALLFENGLLGKPLVIGKILVPGHAPDAAAKLVTAKMDDDVLTLSARQQIVLQCGKASITLTRAGKIILRGAYLLSRSSGVNKIKGGSVQIN
jgi:Domain of unknown function (DUF6484)